MTKYYKGKFKWHPRVEGVASKKKVEEEEKKSKNLDIV